MRKTIYVHTKCGGEIDPNFFTGRKCRKCGKKWNPIAFLLSFGDIRPVVVKVPRQVKKAPTTYAGWAGRIPGAVAVASLLPNWPRWARILVTLGFISLVVVTVHLIRG